MTVNVGVLRVTEGDSTNSVFFLLPVFVSLRSSGVVVSLSL